MGPTVVMVVPEDKVDGEGPEERVGLGAKMATPRGASHIPPYMERMVGAGAMVRGEIHGIAIQTATTRCRVIEVRATRVRVGQEAPVGVPGSKVGVALLASIWGDPRRTSRPVVSDDYLDI